MKTNIYNANLFVFDKEGIVFKMNKEEYTYIGKCYELFHGYDIALLTVKNNRTQRYKVINTLNDGNKRIEII
jgi:hypothetical protein